VEELFSITELIYYIIYGAVLEAILVSASLGLLIGVSLLLLANKYFPPEEK
tara:strand:+ start:183 stop:335 length:153 start_codon:yes stop_codon:yes gene_type:complete